jgi:hypothetical protein
MNLREITSRLLSKAWRLRTQIKYEVEPYGTHAQFLKIVLQQVLDTARNDYYIVEIGTGGMSSLLLRDHIERDSHANLISVESNPVWEEKYRKEFAAHPRHEIIGFEKSSSWLKVLETLSDRLVDKEVAITFIDSAPWSSRTLSALLFREKSNYLLVHDCDYFPRENIWGVEKEPILYSPDSSSRYGNLSRENLGSRSYDDMFRFWLECFPSTPGYFTGPPTLIASNILDVRKLEFNGDEIFFTSTSSYSEKSSEED